MVVTPNEDFAFLKRTREEWGCSMNEKDQRKLNAFEERLREIWIQRSKETSDISVGEPSPFKMLATFYEPGDYKEAYEHANTHQV